MALRKEFPAGRPVGKMRVHLKDLQREGARKKLVLGDLSEVNGLPDLSLLRCSRRVIPH